MPVEMRMWRIDGDEPRRLTTASLPTDRELHEFLARDPSLFGERLLVIGSEVQTLYGKRLDLLAIDADGNLHILELKRDRTPREVVAQVLDYGSWVTTLSRDDVIDLANRYLPARLRRTHQCGLLLLPGGRRSPLPGPLVACRRRIHANHQQQQEQARPVERSRLVRLLRWRPTMGGRSDLRLHLRRRRTVLLANPARAPSRRSHLGQRPRNGLRRRWHHPLSCCALRRGSVLRGGEWVKLTDQPLTGNYLHQQDEDDDQAEWVAPVEWQHTLPEREAFWEKGMFASQHSACKLRQEFTLDRLTEHFGLDNSDT